MGAGGAGLYHNKSECGLQTESAMVRLYSFFRGREGQSGLNGTGVQLQAGICAGWSKKFVEFL